ncbi:MAG TPA: hypothetical protein PK029_00045 [Bacteroidales bacterium]|nr:hypothetical protein [Bacteroidales bacterium]
MKKIIFTLAITCYFISSFAQDADFVSTSNSIRIISLYSNTLSQINKIEAKETKVVQIDKSISQEDFDKICAKLKWIKKLSFDYDNSYITNITSIENLSSLESLKMRNITSSYTQAIDVTPLAKITSLKELDVLGTVITNIQALSTLVNLEKVNVTDSKISSIDFLQNTPLLKELVLAGSNHTFVNYEPIQNLKKLRVLDIQRNTQATDVAIAQLQNLQELRELDISDCNGITSIKFIAQSTKLTEFNAANCKNIVDFSPIQDLILLKKINLSGSSISDISILSNKTDLKDLNISKTPVSDISTLHMCAALERLDISNTQVTDITTISRLWKLKRLSIAHTKVASLEALSANFELTDLDASYSQVSDLSPVSQCKKLTNIIVYNSKVTDVKALYSLNKITSLRVDSSIPLAQIDALKIRFPLIRIDVAESGKL